MLSVDVFLKSTAVKVILFFILLLPLLYLILLGWGGGLGSDPAKFVVEYLATTAFNLLLITISVRPLKKLTGVSSITRFRRMLGLYVYFYVVLHVGSYLLFMADWSQLVSDLIKRPYISVGFVSFLLLSALAITSNKVSMRRLGSRWGVLHRLVYLAVVLVLIHFVWQERADYSASFIYFCVILALFLARFGLSSINYLIGNSK